MLHIPTVEACFGCINLESAAKTIGTMESLTSTVAVLHDVYLILTRRAKVRGSRFAMSGLFFDLLVSSLEAVLGPSLLLAVKQRNSSALRVWLTVHLGLYFLALVFYISSMLVLPCCGHLTDVSFFEKLMTLYSFRNFILYGYCIIVVNSFYEKVLVDFNASDVVESGKSGEE